MQKVHGRDLTPEEMAQLLEEFVNGHSESDNIAFADEVVFGVHRTLQQKIMGMFLKLVEKWAELPESQYDLRNAATIRLAAKMIKATGDKYDRHLPRI